jgi:serine/threonine-protein kinase
MTPPSTIAHYKLTSKLGEGGMGAVYRATDIKLNRDVAIKLLPDAFACDPDRMARFAREAQVLASLNHPNIAAIYGVEDRALIMELVDGETLETHLQSALPLEQSLAWARQIIDGLESAHEKGIIHRDLKPANIKVTVGGVVKLLDFGLAKAADETAQTAAAAAGRATMSPTMSIAMTQAGVIMGTAAYMSPEQARGKPVDKRADIWAFGVVLYEMLTGKHPYGTGETVTDTLAAVVLKEADFAALPDATPPRVRKLLERCLKKDPKQRLRDIGDARLILDESEPESRARAGAEQRGRPRYMLTVAIAAAVLFLAAMVAGTGWWRAAHPEPKPVVRLTVDLGRSTTPGLYGNLWLSRPGTHMAYLSAPAEGGRAVSVRRLDQPDGAVLATDVQNAFFSPDGRWLGVISAGKIRKVPVEGGPVVTVCDFDGFNSTAAWGEDGNIVFAGRGGLSIVSADGGAPRKLSSPNDHNESGHQWPSYLPGGKAVLFSAQTVSGDIERSVIDVVTVRTGEWKRLIQPGYAPKYLASGHLAFFREGRVFAVGFDPDKLEVRGTPVPVIQDMAEPYLSYVTFEASDNGTVAYESGNPSQSTWQIVSADSSGKVTPLVQRPASYRSPRFSPDGKRLIATVKSSKGYDLWTFDLERHISTQLTFDANLVGDEVVWKPNGKYIVFSTEPSRGLSFVRADGSGGVHAIPGARGRPNSFSPDGRRLLCTMGGVFVVPIDLSDPEHPKGGEREWLLQQSGVHDAELSPDGRWVAYSGVTIGREEIFVMPYKGAGKWRVSINGGKLPRWSRTARELFFRDHEGRVLVAGYTTAGDAFTPEHPRIWGPTRIRRTGVISNWDLAPDGKHIAAFPLPEGANTEDGNFRVTFLLNYFDELRRKVPPGK